jgi:hypothetical protein
MSLHYWWFSKCISSSIPATIPATTSTGNTAGHYNGTDSPTSMGKERKDQITSFFNL